LNFETEKKINIKKLEEDIYNAKNLLKSYKILYKTKRSPFYQNRFIALLVKELRVKLNGLNKLYYKYNQ